MKLKGRREKARPTPSKTVSIIRSEGKSHRTKRELRQREQAEKAVLTGIPLKERPEVRENETAHKEFLRLKKLLEKIDKFDDMYGAVINRYCILYAETKEFEEKKLRKAEYEAGVEAGIELGERSLLENQIRKKLKKGKPIEQIADELEEAVTTIQRIIEETKKEN